MVPMMSNGCDQASDLVGVVHDELTSFNQKLVPVQSVKAANVSLQLRKHPQEVKTAINAITPSRLHVEFKVRRTRLLVGKGMDSYGLLQRMIDIDNYVAVVLVPKGYKEESKETSKLSGLALAAGGIVAAAASVGLITYNILKRLGDSS